MKFTLPIILALLTGCASVTTDQIDDRSYDPETGHRSGSIRTRARALSFAAGKQALQGWKAQQTSATQGMSLTSGAQESDAGPLMGAIAQGVGQAMIGAMTGRIPATAAPTASTVPPGFKLVPVDDPSRPQPEIR